jgi:tripartite-type tricarboxylate transporter receptor subunit TctC
MSMAAKSAPDGYTLLTASNSLASNAALYKNMDYDPAHDLVPVGAIGYAPLVVVVPQASPFKTLPELIAFGKANPDKLNYGSAGNGSSGHLASELLKDEGKFEALHVPYKGGMPAITDMIGNRISFMSINPLEVLPHVQAGKLRTLAVMDKQPTPLLPSVPTVTSLQLPSSTATVWWGMIGPKGMPADVVALLNRELNEVLVHKAVAEKFAAEGTTAVGGTPEQMMEIVRSDIERWKRVAETAKVKIE